MTTAHYVKVTGDIGVLDEAAPFLEGPALDPEESDAFFQPAISNKTASLYEHCARALDASLAVGRHGAPLIGGGDWNDGMNRALILVFQSHGRISRSRFAMAELGMRSA